MALLLSARRGWLPAGFTELEYLESSGTQYISAGEWNSADLVSQTVCFIPERSAQSGTRAVFSGSKRENNDTFFWVPSVFQFRTTPQQPCIFADLNYNVDIPAAAGKVNNIILRADELELNGEVIKYPGMVREFDAEVYVFAAQVAGYPNYFSIGAKIYKITFTQSDKKLDLRPVLDASGTPAMFDKISKQCFYNNGSGRFGYRVKTTGATSAPMSLRDPYYTAPSGVYARPSGDNQLEILADTEEPTGDGWEWFANTGEAYEHFGITQEELLTNESTND